MKKTTGYLLLCMMTVLLCSATPVLAEFGAKDITFTPQAGYYQTGSAESGDSGFLAGLGIDYRLSDVYSMETFLGRAFGAEDDLSQVRLDLLYHLRKTEKKYLKRFVPKNSQFIPYASLGAGFNVVRSNSADRDASDFLIGAGGGIKYLLKDNWMLLRLDVRAIYAGDSPGVMTTLGICFPFGPGQFAKPLGSSDKPAPETKK